MDNLRKIHVNFENMSLAIEDPSSCTSYLDTETGEIIRLSEKINESTCFDASNISHLPAPEKSMALKAQKILGDETGRYVCIPKIDTCEEYEFMCDFTDTITDDNLRLKLLDALDGKDASSGFEKIIQTSPQLENSWQDFKEKQTKQYIIDFLSGNGLDYVF